MANSFTFFHKGYINTFSDPDNLIEYAFKQGLLCHPYISNRIILLKNLKNVLCEVSDITTLGEWAQANNILYNSDVQYRMWQIQQFEATIANVTDKQLLIHLSTLYGLSNNNVLKRKLSTLQQAIEVQRLHTCALSNSLTDETLILPDTEETLVLPDTEETLVVSDTEETIVLQDIDETLVNRSEHNEKDEEKLWWENEFDTSIIPYLNGVPLNTSAEDVNSDACEGKTDEELWWEKEFNTPLLPTLKGVVLNERNKCSTPPNDIESFDELEMCGPEFMSSPNSNSNYVSQRELDINDVPEIDTLSFLNGDLKTWAADELNFLNDDVQALPSQDLDPYTICNENHEAFIATLDALVRELANTEPEKEDLLTCNYKNNTEYKCVLCDDIFLEKYLLRHHIKEKHNIVYHCQYCNSNFTTQEVLQKHIHNVHIAMQYGAGPSNNKKKISIDTARTRKASTTKTNKPQPTTFAG